MSHPSFTIEARYPIFISIAALLTVPKVEIFPFEDHNAPPFEMIEEFCENVVRLSLLG